MPAYFGTFDQLHHEDTKRVFDALLAVIQYENVTTVSSAVLLLTVYIWKMVGVTNEQAKKAAGEMIDGMITEHSQ